MTKNAWVAQTESTTDGLTPAKLAELAEKTSHLAEALEYAEIQGATVSLTLNYGADRRVAINVSAPEPTAGKHDPEPEKTTATMRSRQEHAIMTNFKAVFGDLELAAAR